MRVNSQSLDVASFDASLKGVILPIGLKLDQVTLRGNGLHLENDPFRASVTKPGDMVVTVTQESLAEFLNQQSPAGLRNFQVTAQNGKLIVQASKTILFEVRATALCTLRIVDGSQLFVDLESVDVMGGGSLTNMVRSQLDALNPILDAKDLPVKAVLNTVDIDAGQVVLRGKVSPPTA